MLDVPTELVGRWISYFELREAYHNLFISLMVTKVGSIYSKGQKVHKTEEVI